MGDEWPMQMPHGLSLARFLWRMTLPFKLQIVLYNYGPLWDPAMSFEKPETCNDLLSYRVACLLASSGALVVRLCEGRYGISRREWRLIAKLADYGPLSPSDLARHAQCDRPLVSRAIADMVAKGLVSRSNEAGNKRKVTVELTGKGQALHAEIFPQTAAIGSRILQALSPEEVRAFEHALDVLTASAKEVNLTYPLTEKANRSHGGSRLVASSSGPDLTNFW
jgi:DNA-binding MarR family transcriptional regulator